MKIYNTTLHRQADTEADLVREGYTLVPDIEPHGVTFPLAATVEDLRSAAESIADAAVAAGAEGLLVGGLSGMAIMLDQAAARRGLAVVEVATEHRRRGAFAFAFRGVRVLRGTHVPAWKRVIQTLRTKDQWVLFAEERGRHDGRCEYEWPENPGREPWQPISDGCPEEWAGDVYAAYVAAYERNS